MNKIILLYIAFSTFTVLGQSKFVAGGSFNVGIPTGSFDNEAETGIGGSIIGEYFFNKEISTTLSVSYQNYPGNFPELAVQGKVLDVSINSIPVVVAGRYYLGYGAFTTLELGSYFFRINIEASDIYEDEKYSSDYEAKFGGGFGFGYRFNLSEQSGMEFAGIYQIIEDNLNSISLRLGIMLYLDQL